MKYRIICVVRKASGSQSWTVDAESEADALTKHAAGESEPEHEEIDVTELGEPEVEEA